MALIIALFLLGLILISVEFFIPGGIVGAIGVVMLLGAVGYSYNEYGLLAAGWVLFACMLIGGLWAYMMFSILSKTRYGKKMFLKSASSGRIRYGSRDDCEEEAQREDELVGSEGTAITAMSPTGRIEINGTPYEASSQSGFLQRGTRVQVVGRSSFGFVVRKL